MSAVQKFQFFAMAKQGSEWDGYGSRTTVVAVDVNIVRPAVVEDG